MDEVRARVRRTSVIRTPGRKRNKQWVRGEAALECRVRYTPERFSSCRQYEGTYLLYSYDVYLWAARWWSG